MTKKKPPSQRETLNPPTIPRNAMGRWDAQDSGFINGWLKNRKRGAPLRIAPQTTTKKKKKGKKTTESQSVVVIVSPVTISADVASDTTAVNTASTNGEATALHQSPNCRGNIQGMLKKIIVLPTQIQQPNQQHARENTTIGTFNPSNQRWPVPSKKIERHRPTISIGGYHYSRGGDLRLY